MKSGAVIRLEFDGRELMVCSFEDFLRQADDGVSYLPGTDEWLKVVCEGIKEELAKV